MKILKTDMYLLLINEEAEIKDWYYWNDMDKALRHGNNLNHPYHHKVVAYFPLNSEAKELDLPLLPDPFENKFNVTEWAKEEHKFNHKSIHELSFILGYEVGYQKAQSKQLENFIKTFNELWKKFGNQ